MISRMSRLCASLVVAGIVCGHAMANTITIGTSTSGNVFPFGYPNYVGEYQQDYNGALFGGPVYITGITFFASQFQPRAVINGTYTLNLSNTAASTGSGPGGLSTTYASNIGSNNTLFFSGAVSNTLTFAGGPFLYDPSKGNLLLDVHVIAPNLSINPLAAGCSADTNRVYNLSGNGTPSTNGSGCLSSQGYGLETEFAFTPTPEPSSLILLGTGLVGVALRTTRRKFFARQA